MDVEIDDNLLFHPWYKSNKDITKVINNKAV